MLNTSIRGFKMIDSKYAFRYVTKKFIHNTIRFMSCPCGTSYLKNQRLRRSVLYLNSIKNNHKVPIEIQLVRPVSTDISHVRGYHVQMQTFQIKRHKENHVKNVRTHSTQSDHHRQKVVIETSTPKLVIDKLKVDKLTDKKLVESSLEVFWKQRVEPYIKLSRWDKPIGVYLLYWPCSWSIALASIPGNVPLSTSVEMAALFLVGAGLMRGAGCTINDLWDRDIDAKVERTKDRPLVSGAITEKQAIGFLALQLSLGLGVLLQLNCYSVALGASSMILVVTYPLAKRFTNYPQLFLGATFNWGALLGYSAVQGHAEPAVCVPLYLSALAWTVLYDTIYAHQDKRDDARLGIKSTALTFGAHTKPALSAALALSLCGLSIAGHEAGLSAPYYAALAMYAAHAGTQIYTLNLDNPDDCARKFKSNSMVGLIILLGILGGGYQQYIENRQKHRGKEDPSVARSCFFS